MGTLDTRGTSQPNNTPASMHGVWWRFRRYEIVDGFIVAGANAALDVYDPWREYARGGSADRELRTPYMDLLDTRNAMAATADKDEQNSLILAACRKYGLLGLLPHRTTAVYLRDDSSGCREFHRGPDGWVELERTSVGATGVLMSPIGRPYPTLEPVSEWTRYFGEAGAREREDYLLPTTDEFWRRYREPVDEYIGALHRLCKVIECLGRPVRDDNLTGPVIPEPESNEAFRWWDAVDRLNAMIGVASPAIVPARHHTPQGKATRSVDYSFHVWTPSLLSALALMATFDTAGNTFFVQCRGCNRLFATRRSQKQYCGDTCRNRVNKTLHRQRKREQQAAGS